MNFNAFRTLTSKSYASRLLLALTLTMTIGTARAQDKTYVMKITAPTQNASPDTYARNYAAAVEKASGGRIKAEVYPASQLGSIPRQIEGTQFGAIQCAVIPPEFFVGVDERFEVLAAPRPRQLRGAGTTFGDRPAGAEADARARRRQRATRCRAIDGRTKPNHRQNCDPPPRRPQGQEGPNLASDFQSTTFKRLGATPVAMSLGDVLPAIQQGAIDGATGGIEAFTGLHFYDTAKYITTTHHAAIFLPVVEVSRKWYDSLPADCRKL